MSLKNVFIQLTSAGLDTGNFTITDCNGNVVLLGEIGGSSSNATNISRDDMLIGITCSVATECDNVIVTSYTSNCSGSSVNIPITTTTSTTTTTTTSYAYGFVSFKCSTTNYTIDSVVDNIGNFYTLTTGSFPISNGPTASGTFTRPVNTPIIVSLSYSGMSIPPVVSVDLYKNEIFIEQVYSSGTGGYTFSSLPFGSGDDLKIVVSDGL